MFYKFHYVKHDMNSQFIEKIEIIHNVIIMSFGCIITHIPYEKIESPQH